MLSRANDPVNFTGTAWAGMAPELHRAVELVVEAAGIEPAQAFWRGDHRGWQGKHTNELQEESALRVPSFPRNGPAMVPSRTCG